MKCKICGNEFEPYQITDNIWVADTYICKPCLMIEVERYDEQHGTKHVLTFGTRLSQASKGVRTT